MPTTSRGGGSGRFRRRISAHDQPSRSADSTSSASAMTTSFRFPFAKRSPTDKSCPRGACLSQSATRRVERGRLGVVATQALIGGGGGPPAPYGGGGGRAPALAHPAGQPEQGRAAH